jgi:hypothetical protein
MKRTAMQPKHGRTVQWLRYAHDVFYMRGSGNVTPQEFVTAGRELADAAVCVEELIVHARAALARMGTRHPEGVALQKALERVA